MPIRVRKPHEPPKPSPDRQPLPPPYEVGEGVKYNGKALWGEKVTHGSIGVVTAIKAGWMTALEVHDGYSIVDFPEGRVAIDVPTATKKFESVGKLQTKSG